MRAMEAILCELDPDYPPEGFASLSQRKDFLEYLSMILEEIRDGVISEIAELILADTMFCQIPITQVVTIHFTSVPDLVLVELSQ